MSKARASSGRAVIGPDQPVLLSDRVCYWQGSLLMLTVQAFDLKLQFTIVLLPAVTRTSLLNFRSTAGTTM